MGKNPTLEFPKDLDVLRARISRAISPIQPAAGNGGRDIRYWTSARRTKAGSRLPPYYLLYFMLVDLLEFSNLGQFEKQAWSVPIDFKGVTFTVTHAKFGLGVFVPEPDQHEDAAGRVVELLIRGVRVAEPYFEWRAATAVGASALNVVNRSGWLLERYRFLREQFNVASADAEARKDESKVTTVERPDGGTESWSEWPYYNLRRNAKWLGLAAVDAFFSWTEHVFIHLSILQGRKTTGSEVAELADSDWPAKFRAALDISDRETKAHFDRLVVIRRQLRNFMAHGAFGKQGEAFRFHSGAGAVPVLVTRRPGKGRFSLADEPEIDEAAALQACDQFFAHLWSGTREPARVYLIEEATIPTILPMASDGTYAAAMASVDAMKSFVDELTSAFDDAANMDW
jgi:hypothetical protein